MASISKLSVRLLHEDIVSQLRDYIIEGAVEPGVLIDEKELSSQFGISRTPVREALKVLASEGLVELKPRKGAVVTQLTTDLVFQQFEAVIVIECYAVAKLCAAKNTAGVAKLAAINSSMKSAFNSDNPNEYSKRNLEFHRQLVALIENDVLAEIHRRLTAQLHRSRYSAAIRLKRRRTFLDEHSALLEELQRLDGAASERLLRVHLENVRATVLEAFG